MQPARQSRAGFIALVLGFAVALSIYFWLKMMNTVPLNIPVSLSVGHIRTPYFRPTVAIPYDIDIVFDSGIPHGELDCLIGMNLKSVQPCSGQPSVLNVNWQLLSDGRNMANGSSTEIVGAEYSYHRTDRHIGRFQAEYGRTYRLELEVLQDGTQLDRANPRLEVQPFLNTYDGRLLIAGLTYYLAILTVIVGIVMILHSQIREKRLRNGLLNNESTRHRVCRSR